MTRKRRILLFPAGPAQREAFIAARQLGLEIITVDRNPDAACRPLADAFAILDPVDADALTDFALTEHRRMPLSGALLVGCDIPVSLARVTQALGTPGITLEAATLTVDKLRMKQVLRAKGVAVPDFYAVTTPRDVEEILTRHGRRMIIKPNDNSGARGVQQLQPGDDCERAFAHAARNVKNGGIILEVFEPGPQVSIEALVHRGKIHLTGFADRNYDRLERYYPFVLENGATLPTELSPDQQRCVEEMFCKGIRALGIDNGVAKGDMVLTPEGPKVIEIAGRISGGKFASMIVPESTGVRLLHAALQMAVGLEPDVAYLTPTGHRGVAVRYMFPPEGLVQALSGVEDAQKADGVIEVVTCYSPGDTIGPMLSHADRGGWVVCSADTRETAVQRAESALANIHFELGLPPHPGRCPQPDPEKPEGCPGPCA